MVRGDGDGEESSARASYVMPDNYCLAVTA